MNKLNTLAMGIIGGLGAAGCTSNTIAKQEKTTSQPNIVILFVDDLGWADINYRSSKFDIPNIKKLMANGMTFTDAYASSPCCSPSRASLISGQHPARLKLVRHIPWGDKFGRHSKEFHGYSNDPVNFQSRNWLPLEVDTYAEALKKEGYKNAFIGKWHLGHEEFHPINQGFDEQHGVSNFGHPKGYYPPYFYNGPTYQNVPKGKYLTDKLTDDAVSYLQKQDGDAPFQMTLWYYSAHTPFQGRKDLLKKYQQRGLKRGAANQAAMLESIDISLGRIHATLEAKGLSENTAIFLLGDQGSLFTDHPMRGNKRGGQALYEGGARIPFIVNWSGKTTPGSTSAIPVTTNDVFPTMLTMAGGSPAEYPLLDGKDITPLLKKEKGFKRDEIFLYRSYEDQYGYVRSEDWKMIAYRSGKVELFNLKRDVSEINECSAKNPAIVSNLKAKLAAFEKRTGVDHYKLKK